MFGFLKSKPADPVVVIENEIEIEASAERIFDLLDLSNSSNRLAERGFEISPVADDPLDLVGTSETMPDCEFHFRVLESDRPSRYSLLSWFSSPIKLGALVKGKSEYVITPLKTGTCTVQLTETSTFEEGITAPELKREAAVMTLSIIEDLGKLKVHAEGGANTVPASLITDEDLSQL